MANWEKYLEKIYFNPEHPDSFEGPLRLYKEGKFKISHSQIKKMDTKARNSRNKGVKRKFERTSC